METIKISYFNSISENRLEDDDAYSVEKKEMIDELYYLEDDNESYVRIFTAKNNYQIICEDYDTYKLFEYDFQDSRFLIVQFCNFEEIKSFVKQLYSDRDDISLKEISDKYIYEKGSRFYKDEDGNLIEDN